jgi:DNA transposition AAA+ family ATPase
MDAPFIETKQYQRFKEFCGACRKYQYIGLCYGMPGVGKTLSARHYADWDRVIAYSNNLENSAVLLEEMLKSETVIYTPEIVDTPKHIAEAITRLRRKLYEFHSEELSQRRCAALVDASRRDSIDWYRWHDSRESIRGSYTDYPRSEPTIDQVRKTFHKAEESISDPTALIIIAEADRLKMTGLEQMRAIFDEGGIGLVLIGMPGLEKRLARYPQLYSRVGFVYEFKPLSQADVRQLLREGWLPSGVALPDEGLIDEEALATLLRHAEGKFRALHHLLQQIGRIMEINGLDKVTREVVEDARKNLVIGTA